ncbi:MULTISPECIES: hypothetical protein [unclassified Sphingomonas]|jgi:hypothetical protein|uniref:hypothetical protein n=1 Tax=unclassified Sphingomonas TaxID=196159 RepID=UPI000E10611D|nr:MULTISPECIES: hypothetical protein [unclassified Sphingomonas]AXJ95794.1 hypothetical protein DM480_10015 [Sphingomonas sp. FARSPH]
MIHVLVFNLVLGIACALALYAGGAPERWTALIFIVGAAATFIAPFYNAQHPFGRLEPMLLGVDVLMLIGLVGIAVRADRYWPLYVSALHLITIAVHGVKAIQPDLVPWMYAGASGKIAYPMLLLLAIGAVRHRDRVARFGSDPDWSPL